MNYPLLSEYVESLRSRWTDDLFGKQNDNQQMRLQLGDITLNLCPCTVGQLHVIFGLFPLFSTDFAESLRNSLVLGVYLWRKPK